MALVGQIIHVVTTLGWSIICLGHSSHLCGRGRCLVDIWPPETSAWRLNLSEAPIPAFKHCSSDKQYGHRAVIFNLFPFTDGRQGSYREKVSPPTGFSLIVFAFRITTCLGTGHPWSQVNRWQVGGPWPGVSGLSNGEQQRWNVTMN